MCRIEPIIVPARDAWSGREISHESIALRAFDKWLARGCPETDDGSQDWLAAVAELECERTLLA
ncbi:MAG TPA: DUF2934 domain-containing protein [Polyangiaceae bacterium]|nr:DUF2934 domain-containing protein [Polyangiaceae bacterium]